MTMPATVPGTQLLGGLYVGGAAQEMSPAHTSWKTWKSWKGFAMAGDRYLSYYKAIWDSFEDGSDPVQNVLAVADQEQQVITKSFEDWLAVGAEEIERLEQENARLRAELAENTGVMQVLRRQRDEAEQENARLCFELDSTKAAHRAVWEKHQARGQKIFDLQGEIVRLREERDDYYDAIQRVLEWCATTAHVSAAASVLEALEG